MFIFAKISRIDRSKSHAFALKPKDEMGQIKGVNILTKWPLVKQFILANS